MRSTSESQFVGLNLRRIGVDGVPAPISLLVTISVHRKVIVVDLRVINISVDVDLIEYFRIGLVHAKSSHLSYERAEIYIVLHG